MFGRIKIFLKIDLLETPTMGNIYENTKEPQNVAIAGYGKMGQNVEKALYKRGIKPSMIIDPAVAEKDPGKATKWEDADLSNIDTGFVFTSLEGGFEATERFNEAGCDKVVIGTTGFLDEKYDNKKTNYQVLDESAKENGTRMINAANFSIGMNSFWKALPAVAEIYANADKDYGVYIIEAHHTKKVKDVSGTSKVIADILLEYFTGYNGKSYHIDNAIWVPDEAYDNRIFNPNDPSITDQYGNELNRQVDEGWNNGMLPIVAIRTDNIPGDHRVVFISDEDHVNLDHSIDDKITLGKGAVDSAFWLTNQSPGMHDITERLG